jgi:hypothetical protein
VLSPEPPAPPSIAELRSRAETFILDLIRNTPAFDFWKTELWESLENKQVRSALGMPKEDERSWNEILDAAIERINKRSRSFKISLDAQRYRSYMTVTLLKSKEWEDLCKEVWADSQSDNPRRGSLRNFADAAKLLEWIEGLRDKDYLGKWTPVVEDELEKKIGIQCPWDDANLPAYLTELLNELNERTPYELTLQPWKCYPESKHRIRVSQKRSDEAVLIQQIQLFALKQGKVVPVERIRELISELQK